MPAMMTSCSLNKALAAAALLAAFAPAGLLAQWPAYPTAGVPKTADGKPNLSGPVPKTADGKPDLSGVWQYTRTPTPPGINAPAAPPAATAPGTSAPRDLIPL